MRRIFGAKKEKPPPPTLEQATDKLGTRGDALDEKIRKLDEQLAKHKEAIKKCRPGPAQEAAKRRALVVSVSALEALGLPGQLGAAGGKWQSHTQLLSVRPTPIHSVLTTQKLQALWPWPEAASSSSPLSHPRLCRC